jgi:hypothetical protein
MAYMDDFMEEARKRHFEIIKAKEDFEKEKQEELSKEQEDFLLEQARENKFESFKDAEAFMEEEE